VKLQNGLIATSQQCLDGGFEGVFILADFESWSGRTVILSEGDCWVIMG
jgi:hypothetical protein